MASNRALAAVAALALVLGTGGGAAAGWIAGQASTSSTGATGADGADGATGATGASGAAGDKGADGSDGATGTRGPAGDRGIAGAAGAQGPIGPAGSAGPAGPPGPPGQTGANGQPGADGADGAPGVNGQDGIAPFAFVPLADESVAPLDSTFLDQAPTTAGTVSFLSTDGSPFWQVAEAGFYRVTLRGDVSNSGLSTDYGVLGIGVNSPGASYASVESRTPTPVAGGPVSLSATYLGIMNPGATVVLYLKSEGALVYMSISNAQVLWEKLG